MAHMDFKGDESYSNGTLDLEIQWGDGCLKALNFLYFSGETVTDFVADTT